MISNNVIILRLRIQALEYALGILCAEAGRSPTIALPMKLEDQIFYLKKEILVTLSMIK
jgi:hypothetical protein